MRTRVCAGDLPAEDPHHSFVQCADAQEVPVQDPVGLSAAAVHRRRYRAGRWSEAVPCDVAENPTATLDLYYFKV